MHALEVSGQTIPAEALEAFRRSLETTPAPAVIAFLSSVARSPDTPENQPADTYWTLVQRLQKEPTALVFDEMAHWSENADAGIRLAAIHVLGQLGFSHPGKSESNAYPFARPTAPIIECLLSDDSVSVVCAALAAAGHLRVGDLRIMEGLVAHADANVRFDLAFALLTRDEPAARTLLIHLSTDPVASVRDWATFGLGSQSDVDTPAIRQALLARLDDDDTDTRIEAIKGLAKRQDKRCLPALIEAISRDEFDPDLLELAKAWADPALMPILKRLRAAQTEP